MPTLFEIFTIWLTFYTIVFCVLPVQLCLEWYRRRSSDGYSGFNFVCILTSISLWLRYALLTGDSAQILINAVSISLFISFSTVFLFYQSKRSTFLSQIAVAGALVSTLMAYTERLPEGMEKTEEAGFMAGTVQTLTFAGILYEIFRVFRFGTTEYIPFGMTAGAILLQVQYWVYAIALSDMHIRRANEVGLAINGVVMVLYVLYPPKTWKVPIIGVGGTEAKKDL